MGKVYNQETFIKRLGELMKEHEDTTYSLAEYLHLTPPTISRYLTGGMNPKITAIESLSIKYRVNPAWLMGAPDVNKFLENTYGNERKKVPMLGSIAAGVPRYVFECQEVYEYAEQKVDFCLRVKGDSMINARILDGDTVFIRNQPDVETGEVAAVIIDGEEATLKRVYKINGTVVLRAENPKYKDLIFSKKDMRTIQILGKAVYFKSEVR